MIILEGAGRRFVSFCYIYFLPSYLVGSERFVCHATHAGLALPWHFDCNLGTRLLLVAGYDDSLVSTFFYLRQ